jgi:Mn-dependent DtxR family transcriptional regulator
MDKELAQKVLVYMLSNETIPLTGQEIAASIEADPVQVDKTLQDLQRMGYTYKVNTGYWYMTLPGSKIAAGEKNLLARGTTVYNTLAKKYEGLDPDARNAAVQKSRAYTTSLITAMQEYYDYFRHTHPEYKKFFTYMDNSPTNEEEFFKDVQAMLLRWDVGTHEKLAYSGEISYEYPPNIVALEHIMDESFRRYYNYMSHEKAKFMFQDEYKKTINEVQVQLPKMVEGVNVFISGQAAGTVISLNAIRAWLNDQVGGLSKGVNKELFYNEMLELLPNKLSPKGLVFLSTTPKETVMSAIGEVLDKGKEPAKIFNRLRSTQQESSTFTDADLVDLFQDMNYSGKDLSGINLSYFAIINTNFTGAILKSANFEGARIQKSNFTNANMQFSTFTVSEFADNIVEGADFDGASIAKNIDWDKQVGQAKNVTVSNVTYDKKTLSKVLESRPSVSYSIPVRPEQIGEANTLAKALKGILEKLHTFSNMKKVGWNTIMFNKGDKVMFTDEGCMYVEHIYDIDSEYLSTVIAEVVTQGSAKNPILVRFDSSGGPGGENLIPLTVDMASKYLVKVDNFTESSLRIEVV